METLIETSKTFTLSDATRVKIDTEYVRSKYEHDTTTDPLDKEKRIAKNVTGEIEHLNYLKYLGICWNYHIPVVLKPDYLWQMILCEVGSDIKNNAEKYRSLFTEKTEGKTEITVYTNDPILLPLDSIVEQLRKLVPTGIEKFLPNFSTSTPLATFAFNAAFCDAMSPFYNYSMFMCNIPKIRVEGTVEDWKLMLNSVNEINEILDLKPYFEKVTTSLNAIIDALETDNGEYFKTMFKLTRCGSGSQTEVDGWIDNFFVKLPKLAFINNYSSCISTVEYKNLTTNKEYVLKVGLLGSKFDENEFLVPEFGYAIYDK